MAHRNRNEEWSDVASNASTSLPAYSVSAFTGCGLISSSAVRNETAHERMLIRFLIGGLRGVPTSKSGRKFYYISWRCGAVSGCTKRREQNESDGCVAFNEWINFGVTHGDVVQQMQIDVMQVDGIDTYSAGKASLNLYDIHGPEDSIRTQRLYCPPHSVAAGNRNVELYFVIQNQKLIDYAPTRVIESALTSEPPVIPFSVGSLHSSTLSNKSSPPISPTNALRNITTATSFPQTYQKTLGRSEFNFKSEPAASYITNNISSHTNTSEAADLRKLLATAGYSLSNQTAGTLASDDYLTPRRDLKSNAYRSPSANDIRPGVLVEPPQCFDVSILFYGEKADNGMPRETFPMFDDGLLVNNGRSLAVTYQKRVIQSIPLHLVSLVIPATTNDDLLCYVLIVNSDSSSPSILVTIPTSEEMLRFLDSARSSLFPVAENPNPAQAFNKLVDMAAGATYLPLRPE